jgi:hypothetical protein
MDLLKDPRIVVAGGVAAALVAGILAAMVIGAGAKDSAAPPPASQGGLVVEVGREDVKLDPTRKLSCYVNGQSVGMTTLAECASRNGISSGQLDVGIDQSGEMAFGELGAALTPLPPEAEAMPVAPLTPAPPAIDRGPSATCWRFADRTWVRLADMPLGTCAVTLFEGRCERAGGATYGRWGDQTLRLVPGRIEQSGDNRSFRTLVEQGTNCTVPSL